MQLNITCRHMELTSAIKSYVSEKINKVGHFFEHIGITHVVLEMENNHHKVNVNMHINGADIVAHSHAENMYAAIDLVADKLNKQVIKYKQKLQTKH